MLRGSIMSMCRGIRPFRQVMNLSRHSYHQDIQQAVPPRKFTVVTKNPSETTKESIIEALREGFFIKTPGTSHCPEPIHAQAESKSNHTIIIAATPSFIHWLEDDINFIPKVLKELKESLYPASMEADGQPEPTFEINVVCACVDGLAPKTEHCARKREGKAADEGFSFLHSRTEQIVPALWEAESSTKGDSSFPSSLTFTSKLSDESRAWRNMTLPLANTLFKNGKMSTLLITKWVTRENSFQKVRSEERNKQTITTIQAPGIFNIPSIALTPVRKITSGLGNIVRQIEYDNCPGPASRELEANIEDYLQKSKQPKSTVAVWALVFSTTSRTKMAFDDLVDPYNAPVVGTDQNARAAHEFINHWIHKGASFCRVLSGGGGWGVKQGLLSLDPQTSFVTDSELQFGYSNHSIEEQQALALGSLVKPGSYIQFFTTRSTKDRHETVERILHASTMVFGTVPSTIDDVPSQNRDIAVEASVFIVHDHFGAVSESGIYFEQTDQAQADGNPTSTSTKIDFPYSYAFNDLQV